MIFIFVTSNFVTLLFRTCCKYQTKYVKTTFKLLAFKYTHINLYFFFLKAIQIICDNLWIFAIQIVLKNYYWREPRNLSLSEKMKVWPTLGLFRPVFLNRRDALPGLERFWKLKKSLNSALKSYQLLNLVKNKWLEMQFKQLGIL